MLVTGEPDGRAMVGLQVRDRSIGMTPEQCAQAFERFYRADPSGHILGSGLGLSIVREIIEILGGRVELTSQLGLGTQVTIWLPLCPPAQPDGESTVAEVGSADALVT
jgi:signal transduction histidine kinase